MEQEESNPIFKQKATPLPKSLNPQIIYSWKAPLRAYKKRAKYVLRFYLAVAILLTAIIIFFGDKILIIPIWAVLFLFYALTITPPPIVENKITKFGIETAGVSLKWDVLSYFYFTERFGFTILTLVTNPPYNMRAYMVIKEEETKKNVMKIMAEHVVYSENPKLGITDKLINMISHIIPDDSDYDAETKDKTPIQEVKDTLSSFFQKQKDPSPVSQ